MLAHALIVVLATAASGQPPPPVTLTLDTGTQAPADPVTACAARRLKPFVGPYGVQQAWPVMASPPARSWWMDGRMTPGAWTVRIC